jgi:hypothetical protein
MITYSGRSSNLGNPSREALAQPPQLRWNSFMLVYPDDSDRRCECVRLRAMGRRQQEYPFLFLADAAAIQQVTAAR